MTGAGRYVDFVAFDLMSCAMIDFYLLVVLYFVKSHILSILRDTYYLLKKRNSFPPLLHVCGSTRLLAPGLRSSKFDCTALPPNSRNRIWSTRHHRRQLSQVGTTDSSHRSPKGGGPLIMTHHHFSKTHCHLCRLITCGNPKPIGLPVGSPMTFWIIIFWEIAHHCY